MCNQMKQSLAEALHIIIGVGTSIDTVKYSYSPLMNIMIKEGLSNKIFDKFMNLIQGGNIIKFPHQLMSRSFRRELYRLSLVRKSLSREKVVLKKLDLIDPEIILLTKNTIKMFSFKEKAILSIAKNESNNNFAKKEILSRKKYPSLTPKLLGAGKINGLEFYKEELLTDVYRTITKTGKLKTKNIISLFEKLNRFYEIKQTDREKYLTGLLNATKHLLSKEEQVFYREHFLKNNLKTIAISQVHGDLVPSNILQNKDSFKLIDWTYSTKSSVTYDFFTLLVNIAVTNGGPFDIKSLVTSVCGKKPLLSKIFDSMNIDKKESLSDLLLIFGLEFIRNQSMFNNICPKLCLDVNKEILSNLKKSGIIGYTHFWDNTDKTPFEDVGHILRRNEINSVLPKKMNFFC